MSTTCSFVVEKPRTMRLTEFPIPEPGVDDLLLKVEEVAICGSDPGHYRGARLNPVFPLILGHEVVGWVHSAGKSTKTQPGIREGDRVVVEPYIPCRLCWFCLNGNYQLCTSRRCYGVNIPCTVPPHLWGAYGEYLFVQAGSKVHPIQSTVPAEAACLSSVLGNGFRWVKVKGQVRWGESVAIIGAGAQALASVIVAAESGAEPIIVLGLARDRRGFALAKEFGAHAVIAVDASEYMSVVSGLTAGRLVDVAIECSGAREGLGIAADVLRPLGRCVVVGFPGAETSLVHTEKIVRKELTFIGGLGQAWSVEDAVRLINSRRYAVEKIITHKFPLQDAEKALKFFIDRPEDCIRVALCPG